MSLVKSIITSYRDPAPVYQRMWAGGVEERTNLALVMGVCVTGFVSAWPGLSRQAFLTGEPLDQLMGGALLGWVMIAPLLLYVIALMMFFVSRIWRSALNVAQVRRVLFWSLTVASPLMLLHGLVAGFIGVGPAKTVVGFVWAAVVIRTAAIGFRSVKEDDHAA